MFLLGRIIQRCKCLFPSLQIGEGPVRMSFILPEKEHLWYDMVRYIIYILIDFVYALSLAFNKAGRLRHTTLDILDGGDMFSKMLGQYRY
jgi:hypothetical protein